MMGLELATLGYKPRALSTELTSSKAIAGKELVVEISLYLMWRTNFTFTIDNFGNMLLS